jgi:8-oxo-dGTP pyrophosphatase MutT (NUDIX family)
MDLKDYTAGILTEEEKVDLRFAPKDEVVFLEQPNGKPFTGFRNVGKNWATVFAVLPGDLIPIVGEFKHGAEVISLVPPSGVLSKAEMEISSVLERMMACGKREFQEETGMKLKRVTPLSSEHGLPVSTRQSTQRCYPLLGEIELPVRPGPSKLDQTEHLKMVLIPLGEWMVLLNSGKVYEDCAVSTTYLALGKLGRLNALI